MATHNAVSGTSACQYEMATTPVTTMRAISSQRSRVNSSARLGAVGGFDLVTGWLPLSVRWPAERFLARPSDTSDDSQREQHWLAVLARYRPPANRDATSVAPSEPLALCRGCEA